MARILVVDDDPRIARTLEILLQDEGHDVAVARTGEAAMDAVARSPIDVVLLDLALPQMSGLDVLRALRHDHRDIAVVIITAHGSIDSAVATIKEGAHDYLQKPFTPDQVRHRLSRLLELRALHREVAGLRLLVGGSGETAILTQSRAVLRVVEQARAVAATDATILLTGESGTGKSLLARMIHEHSARASGPFVTVDCAALHDTLLESELFGYRRGAFTGAATDRPGKVDAAQGGTLFLDEVGEIPLALQGKLLRLVEERTTERLGDPTPRPVDARLIAATNRDLDEMVEERSFRRDLLYRLSVVDLCLPPLRQRPEDILHLARHFAVQAAKRHGRPTPLLAEDTERALCAYTWPGNVRELAHVMERAVLLSSGGSIRAEQLPERIFSAPAQPSLSDDLEPLAAVEEAQIRRALTLNLPFAETARRLGIDPATLWRKRKRYGL